ncbi:MAG: Pectate lyase superfamily protein [Planctomycetes bacterium ADurb.Bin126]|nr:MAG: Pectate lyase superfamily protein [Planctomycetes bacterium ADurb.Bin126]
MKHMPIILAAVVLAATVARSAETSQLWGTSGEKWDPAGRLGDFSFAGYRRGEKPFRIPAGRASVADFGAKGDGKTDDTEAFRKAIDAGAGKVVLIPPGRYVLGDLLEIRSSTLVLRGAGSDKTVLLFVKPGEQLRPRPSKTDGNQPTTGWSWGGGLIAIGQRMRDPRSGVRVTAAARRGQNILTVERGSFKPGDEVTLTLHDDSDKTLVKYLYRGQEGNAAGLVNWRIRQIFRVRQVAGQVVTLDRPLRFDVRAEWKPALAPFVPSVTDVGIEGVAFEFPAQPYAGHFKELGFNPVVIESGAAHCWLKDLRVHNADSGPYVNGAFCSIDGIVLTADKARLSKSGFCGHHGITLQGQDSLCTRFDIQTQFIHDVTVQSAVGCVFCRGRAINLNMDHHRWAPYENLFSDIDAGSGKRLWASSGGGHRGSHTAAGETFWNIRTAQPVSWPKNFIDAVNVVGLDVRGKDGLPAALRSSDGKWLEATRPGDIVPADLHQAMLKKRLPTRR